MPQRCVGKVVEISNCRLSIPLLIAVITPFPITAIGNVSGVVSQGERDIPMNHDEH